jgi:hypothetical protein
MLADRSFILPVSDGKYQSCEDVRADRRGSCLGITIGHVCEMLSRSIRIMPDKLGIQGLDKIKFEVATKRALRYTLAGFPYHTTHQHQKDQAIVG